MIQTGNAELDSKDSRGWFVGHFLGEEFGLRSTKDVELKWGIHPAGEVRDGWVTQEARTTICILISGDCTVIFRDQETNLKQQGDYVMWGPGTDHTFNVTEDSVVLTIRWPSIPIDETIKQNT